MNYPYPAVATVSEVIGTSFFKQAEGFTRLWPSLICLVACGIAFACLSLTLRTVPTGVANAI